MAKEVVSATKKFYQSKAIYTWGGVAVLFIFGSILLFFEQTQFMSVALFVIGIILLASAEPVFRK